MSTVRPGPKPRLDWDLAWGMRQQRRTLREIARAIGTTRFTVARYAERYWPKLNRDRYANRRFLADAVICGTCQKPTLYDPCVHCDRPLKQ
jgi:hypothetical protein